MTARTTGLVLLAVSLAAGTVEAGEVYRWTDDKGVVHFADVPPPSVWTYSAESMPGGGVRRTQRAQTAAAVAPQPDGAAAAKTGEQPKSATGPARLVIVDREEVSLGDSTQSFSGKIKNRGGATASDVTVAIRVVEPNSGDECISDEIAIDPSTLAPGDTATFEADFDSPCFAGPTQTELRVEWD